MKNTTLKCVIVLTAICLVIAAALAAVNEFTAPIIEKNDKAAADAALKTVLENASSFEEIDVSSLGFATIKSASTGYSADSNVCGRAYILSAKGYKGGEIKIAVGIVDGKIVKVQTIDCSTQTVGFGSKVGEEWFTSGFDGASADSIVDVDIISGATISSTAYKNAIKDALEADKIITEKGR